MKLKCSIQKGQLKREYDREAILFKGNCLGISKISELLGEPSTENLKCA